MINKKPNFFLAKDLERIRKDAMYIFLISARNDGKSYATKLLCLQEAYKSITNGTCKCEFAYLRRFDIDCKDSMCEPYFADMNISAITNNEYSVLSVYHKDIYFGNINEKTGKVERKVKVGRCFALNIAEHYKSQMYPNLQRLIYEEVISEQSHYLFNEPEALQQLISTLFRHKTDDVYIYLIGNRLSRICPYYNDYGLVGAEKIKLGETLKFELDRTIIKVHAPKPSGYDSKLFLGRAKDVITKGEYITHKYPHLKKPLRKYICQHKLVFEYDYFRYFLRLLTDPEDGTIFWYIEPLTTDYKPGTRIISNQWYSSIYHSYNFRGLTPEEAAAFQLLTRDHKAVYSDNLTGTEFNNLLKNFT